MDQTLSLVKSSNSSKTGKTGTSSSENSCPVSSVQISGDRLRTTKSLYRQGSRVTDDSVFHCIIANRKRLFCKSWVISVTSKPICIQTDHYRKESHTGFFILLTSSREQMLGTLKSCRKLYIVWCRWETSRRTAVYAGSWIHPCVCNNLLLFS